MRQVTWNLGQRLNGGHAPDDVITALAALEPDIVILTEHLPGPAGGQDRLLGPDQRLAMSPVPDDRATALPFIGQKVDDEFGPYGN